MINDIAVWYVCAIAINHMLTTAQVTSYEFAVHNFDCVLSYSALAHSVCVIQCYARIQVVICHAIAIKSHCYWQYHVDT